MKTTNKTHDIIYIDRMTGNRQIEKVYGQKVLQLLYGDHLWNQWFDGLLPWLVKFPPFSAFYGALQKLPVSARKIRPFIGSYGIDESEFLEPVSAFRSFNDFFVRKLKKTARPIAKGESIAVMPADARYYFYQDIQKDAHFIVKGEKLNLLKLLQSKALAKEYQGGSLLVARLCPSDYHRFHFPCECIPGLTRLINGYLYSVNPIAIRKDIEIFTKNKRALCELQTQAFGKVLYLEIGATNVGSINETYTPDVLQAKGAEKGYFEFGASALILLFRQGSIRFDADLLAATQQGIEIRCLMGQRMGVVA